MGVRFPSVATNTFVGPLPATAAETVILTTPPINEPIDNAQVLIFWCASITAGTGVTSHTFRVRRGTTAAGTIIMANTFVYTATAAAQGSGAGMYFDSPGIVAGQQYSLTVTQNTASVAGVFQDGSLLAMVL